MHSKLISPGVFFFPSLLWLLSNSFKITYIWLTLYFYWTVLMDIWNLLRNRLHHKSKHRKDVKVFICNCVDGHVVGRWIQFLMRCLPMRHPGDAELVLEMLVWWWQGKFRWGCKSENKQSTFASYNAEQNSRNINFFFFRDQKALHDQLNLIFH